MANYQLFIIGLCEILGVPRPASSSEQNELNDYVFERRVDFKHPDGSHTAGRIDLYKRNCFVLEAKQSSKRQKKLDANQLALIPEDAKQLKAGTAKRGTGGWDAAMIQARRQAENYTRALPIKHGYPPFLLVVDVGHVIEVYADFSGQGKNYAHFPDRQNYRISLDELKDEGIRERLRAIWLDPLSLDPTRKSAEVTRDIAERLANIARRLEKKHDAKDVAEFLMRCLFSMFAEDVDLLPHGSFTKLLEQMSETPQFFKPAMEGLWQVMDEGGYTPHMNTLVKRFNGSLFKNRAAIALEKEDIHELYIAAAKDWQQVEPAIFGTLLERALDVRERGKFGAHYTPRVYVERLVIPTIIEPLRKDWEEAQARAQDLHSQGNNASALQTVRDFHHKLCTLRVLDPACGTGNFLYVSLELLKKLEGEVLEALEGLGEKQERLGLHGETINPQQFYGLEINPRAVAIADLVLWIGFLKWQIKTNPNTIAEPILHAYGTIRHQDAVLAYDKQTQLTDEDGKPLRRWDGHTMKLHPITGEEIPDAEATIPVYTYSNPRPSAWPEVEFIVGNPPFIGGKDMRAEFGDGYAEACWAARKHMPGGADFVMHFWDKAAEVLLAKKSMLRRFGFITTNSITQTFSRRVIERHMSGKTPLSLVFAIPDHPWMKASDKAAVRIAMTVAEQGEKDGVLGKVISEEGLNTDTPLVELEKKKGKITANFTIGANLALTKKLLANENLCSPGVKLHGDGFLVTPQQAYSLGLGKIAGLEKHIREFRNGRDVAQRPRNVMAIDLYPLKIHEVRDRYPEVYQHVLKTVKPERDHNNRASYKEYWWIFGEPRKELRDAYKQIKRYVTTVHTGKHRHFSFMNHDYLPENGLVNFCKEEAEFLSALSSRIHVIWTLNTCSWMGVGNDSRYIISECFNKFPFPIFASLSASQKANLRGLGEKLDAFRKERLEAHEFLTMTSLYNVLERVRELESGCAVEPLSPKERDIYDAGLIAILKEIHDDIDRATFEAYGWEDLIPALVGKVGATTPSPHKTEAQQAAEEELLSRLVALNQTRAAEEKQGIIHWLRPDYQIPKLGIKAAATQGEQLEAELGMDTPEATIQWEEDGLEQIRIVRKVLAEAEKPLTAQDMAAIFSGRNTSKRKDRVQKVLETLVSTGAAGEDISETGQIRYFAQR